MNRDIERLAISFSGGRTSAVMTRHLLENYSGKAEIAITFANTGLEHPDTLRFVDDCDKHLFAPLGHRVVWMEGVFGEAGVGARPNIVDARTASRNGEPFESYIKKYGVPNKMLPQCSSRLKEEVMESYIRRELGWKTGHKSRNYWTAIGIRADEADRMSVHRHTRKFIYPLVEAGITKADVIRECSSWPFDLQIDEHYGNCVTCWKKSFRKLLTIMQDDPSHFDFMDRMEKQYGHIKTEGRRVFFRGDKSVADLKEMVKQPFQRFVQLTNEQMPLFDPDPFLDVGSSCGESCEIGADE